MGIATGVREGCACQIHVFKQRGRQAEKGKTLERVGLARSETFLVNLMPLRFAHKIKSLGLITAVALGPGVG